MLYVSCHFIQTTIDMQLLNSNVHDLDREKQHDHQNKCQHWTFLQKTASFSILCCDSTKRMVCLGVGPKTTW